MPRKFFLLLLSPLLCVSAARAQAIPAGDVTALAVDKTGCCYVVRGSSVAKYSSDLQPMARYACEWGTIAAIDVSNPLRILLFCKEYLRLQLLDNKLAALGSAIFLPDAGALQPSAACTASDNGVWLADSYRNRLLYLDFTLNTTREAASMLSDSAAVSSMAERDGVVYLSLPGAGLLALDKFGALLHRYAMPAPAWFDVQADRLLYLHRDTLYDQHLRSPAAPPRRLASGVKRCAAGDGRLLVWDGEMVRVVKSEE